MKMIGSTIISTRRKTVQKSVFFLIYGSLLELFECLRGYFYCYICWLQKNIYWSSPQLISLQKVSKCLPHLFLVLVPQHVLFRPFLDFLLWHYSLLCRSTISCVTDFSLGKQKYSYVFLFSELYLPQYRTKSSWHFPESEFLFAKQY